MSEGQIVFELSFADHELRVPIIATLISMGRSESIDGEERHEFLVADELLAEQREFRTVFYTGEQLERLLDHCQLANELQRLSAERFSDCIQKLDL